MQNKDHVAFFWLNGAISSGRRLMRQILYASVSSVPGDGADLAGILQQSRHNNAIDGITGLLWSDGIHFVQAFEGPRASIEFTFQRIQNDSRHHTICVVSDRMTTEREFGTWNMVHRRQGETVDRYNVTMRRLLLSASPSINEQFIELLS